MILIVIVLLKGPVSKRGTWKMTTFTCLLEDPWGDLRLLTAVWYIRCKSIEYKIWAYWLFFCFVNNLGEFHCFC